MRGICFDDTEKVSLHHLPDPTPLAETDAIVRVSMAGLCGSDLHVFHGRETGMDPGTVMGHEFVGEVVEVGKQVAGLSIGDRVAAPFTSNCGNCFFCQKGLTARCLDSQLFGWRHQGDGLHGGQAEYVRVPHAAATLMKVPEQISDPMAILLGDNLSTGYYCAEMAEVSPDGVYVVIGCGMVGLLAIMAAQQLQAGTVFAVDPVSQRREMAEQLGAVGLASAEEAQQRVEQATDGRGADGILELVGLPAAQQLAYDLIRPGGIMSVIGCHCTPHFAFSPVQAYDKNLTYRTGRCSARHYMGQLVEQVCDGALDCASMITHQFSMQQCVEAYDTFAYRKDGCIKAVVVP